MQKMAKVMYKMPRPNDEERSPNEASEAKNPALRGAARRAQKVARRAQKVAGRARARSPSVWPSVVALGVPLAERDAERGCRFRRRLRCCVSLAERDQSLAERRSLDPSARPSDMAVRRATLFYGLCDFYGAFARRAALSLAERRCFPGLISLINMLSFEILYKLKFRTFLGVGPVFRPYFRPWNPSL